MNGNTSLIILSIAIIGIIAIIIVKLHYRDGKKDKKINSLSDLRPKLTKSSFELESSIGEKISFKRRPSREVRLNQTRRPRHSVKEIPKSNRKNPQLGAVKSHSSSSTKAKEIKSTSTIKKENELYNVNEEKVLKEKKPQILKEEEIKNNTLEKPIIKKEEKSEDLKDLFTIDELIKESKKKDKERTKIKNKREEEIKKSIEEQKTTSVVKTPKIEDSIEVNAVFEKDDAPIIKHIEEETPELKYINKKDTSKIEEKYSDLDYRKDLKKIKNVVKSSKFLSDIKNKLAPDINKESKLTGNETFLKSVGEIESSNYNNEPIKYENENYYEDWEPITPEPQYNKYTEMSASKKLDEELRLENTRKIYNMAKKQDDVVVDKPGNKVKTSVSFTLNNEEITLNKNDEIIYNIDGDTYSSKILAIRDDNVIVRYRGKNRTINTDNIKKVY